MALYIPHSILHLARLLYVRPETFGLYYVHTASRPPDRPVNAVVKDNLCFFLYWVKETCVRNFGRET